MNLETKVRPARGKTRGTNFHCGAHLQTLRVLRFVRPYRGRNVSRTTSARYAAMERVNEALTAIGEDPLTGMKVLREVLKHPETPLDLKIQCAQILVKEESAAAEE